MAKIGIGDQIINDAGTCLTVVETPEDGALEAGTVPESRVQDFLDAGYEKVGKDTRVPLQAHELKSLDDIRAKREDDFNRFFFKD